MSDPSSMASSSSSSPRLTTGVINFLVRRGMTTHQPAAAFPLHSPGSDNNDADEMVLLDMLLHPQDPSAHAAEATPTMTMMVKREAKDADVDGRAFHRVRKRPWGKYAAAIRGTARGCGWAPAFDSPEAPGYDPAALALWGDTAVLNFSAEQVRKEKVARRTEGVVELEDLGAEYLEELLGASQDNATSGSISRGCWSQHFV